MITNDNSYHATITLDGKQRELQFKGSDAKRLAQHTAKELTADCRVSGASKLETMLRAGNPLAVFSLSIDDYDILLDHKAGGIFYAVLSDKVDGQDVFDIFIKADNVTFLCDYLRKYKMNHVPQHDAGVCIKESAEVPSNNNATVNQQAGQSHLRYTTDGKENESITVPPRPQPKDYQTRTARLKSVSSYPRVKNGSANMTAKRGYA